MWWQIWIFSSHYCFQCHMIFQKSFYQSLLSLLIKTHKFLLTSDLLNSTVQKSSECLLIRPSFVLVCCLTFLDPSVTIFVHSASFVLSEPSCHWYEYWQHAKYAMDILDSFVWIINACFKMTSSFERTEPQMKNLLLVLPHPLAMFSSSSTAWLHPIEHCSCFSSYHLLSLLPGEISAHCPLCPPFPQLCCADHFKLYLNFTSMFFFFL